MPDAYQRGYVRDWLERIVAALRAAGRAGFVGDVYLLGLGEPMAAKLSIAKKSAKWEELEGPAGFLAFDNRNADLLFQVVSRRYEKKRLVLTTNLAFKDWHTIFSTAISATALVERVVHHADIVTIESESYRLRESQSEAKERRAVRKAK